MQKGIRTFIMDDADSSDADQNNTYHKLIRLYTGITCI